MDEEAGVRAPITRRRRKMSMEQSDDGKPSTAPGTPTKKRGGRKPAKSDLELIDENVAEDNLKATSKKTALKEIKDTIEEKPVTPSRRSARIKSNTSIVSDTVQSFDSPRAKRAARRNSQVGSDNEIPLTPIRQTRRTRRDSTSSIEKQEAVMADLKTTTKIPEAISEEPENSTKVSKGEHKSSDSENSKQSPIRRSPRLLNKNSSSNNLSVDDVKRNDLDDNIANTPQTKIEEVNEHKVSSKVDSEKSNDSIEAPNSMAVKSPEKEELSTSSANLIRYLDMNPKHLTYGNKSLSEVQETNKTKSKRHRTKSWTTITAPSLTNDDFYSDNEKTKKKRQSACYVILENMNNSGSGDCKLNSSKCDDKRKDLDISEKGNSFNKSSIISKDTSLDNKSDKLSSNDERTEHDGGIEKLFKSDPSNNIQAMVIMEDSDTDSKRIKKQKNNANEDQCVPVVDHNLREEKNNDSPNYTLSVPYEDKKNDSDLKQSKSLELNKTSANDSCEPMDVDVTLPEFLTNNESNKVMESKEKSIARESVTNKSLSKSSRISVLQPTCENLDKSGIENKSTLIINELKDSVSENKSPKISNCKLLSKSVNTSNVTEATSEVNKALSQNYSTSTPLQNKNIEKQVGRISKMFDDDISKSKEKISQKKDMSAITNNQSSEAESSADEESVTSDKNDLLDDEAEEASDSYQSGDSRDEEEKQYEKDNEIVEKGETLSSEDELSNDSDYEKDSFIVSSNEEDNDLLSGSGDDLSMSDNELKMSSKSKKKYNERKLKEQKRASREMFESRHKLNDTNKSLKQQSSQSSDSSQSDNDVIRPRNNKRNRLISINESTNKSDSQHSISTENNQDMNSPENSFKNALTEKEITLCDETANETHDPLATQIKIEPKTPGKDISVGFVDTDTVKDTTSQNTSNTKAKNPLEDSDNDSSLSSEDINIAKNYDEVLKELKSKATNVSLNKDENSIEKSKQNISVQENFDATETKESTKRKRKSSQNINDNSSNLNKNTNDSGNIINSDLNQDSKDNIGSNAETVARSNFGNSSLNMSKKSKKNKQLIIDQLNLTQIKDNTKKTTKSKSNSAKKNIQIDNSEDSSESIDLTLLFSEESSNSTDKTSENKTDDKFEEFIPLKKSEAKTNILINEDIVEKEEEMPFFVDTIGDRDEENIDETKQITDSSIDSSDDEPPVEISYKKRSSLVTSTKDKDSIESSQSENTSKNILNVSNVESEKKTKKRLSKSVNQSNMIEAETKELEKICKETLSKTPKSEKKKEKNSISESLNKSNLTEDQLSEVEDIINQTLISGTPKSERKKNKKLTETQPIEVEDATNNSLTSKTPKSDKKKKNLSESLHKSINNEVIDVDEEKHEAVILKTPKSAKKNKKLSESLHKSINNEVIDVDEEKHEAVTLKTPKSAKKNKKLSESLHKSINSEVKDVDEEKHEAVTLKTPKSAKKNKCNISQSFNETNLETEAIDTVVNKSLTSQTPKSAKKKRNLLESSNSIPQTEEIEEINIQSETIINVSIEKKRKKSKSNRSAEDSKDEDVILDRSTNNDNKRSKKKSLLSQLETENEGHTGAIENVPKKDTMNTNEAEATNNGGKKRKRKHSGTPALEASVEGDADYESIPRQSKKLRVSQTDQETANKVIEDTNESGSNEVQNISITSKKKTKNNKSQDENNSNEVIDSTKVINESQNKNKNSGQEIQFTGRNGNKENGNENMQDVTQENRVISVTSKVKGTKSKKRKNREDDDGRHKDTKVLKENSLDQIHIPRLPSSVLNNLVDKPKMKAPVKKQKAISTTKFEVLETSKARTKPSNYLEESIYIKDIDDDSGARKKQKGVIKNPRVLPFVPTAAISNSGFTTNFKVNIIPQEIKFVAQSNNVTNFKNDYLYRQKINRNSQTHTSYKRNRNIKMSKF